MPNYRRILVLLDLSAGSEQVLAAAKDMAAQSQAELVALHVVEYIPVEPMGETLLPSMQIQTELMSRARERLTELAHKAGIEAARRIVETGNTKAQILRIAEQETPDLIVLGSRERHGLAILVNFTEDTVLHAAHCDVLAVRLK